VGGHRDPLRALTVYLAKQGMTESDLINRTRAPKRKSVSVAPGVKGSLYAEASTPREPSWASFLREGVQIDDLGLRSSSASAVLVLSSGRRLFALSFGHGRHLLDAAAIEGNFGLRTTLNAVSADRIRSIDKKAFEGIATHTREQASKETGIADFGLNVERDVLRAVVGAPDDQQLATSLAGMDALTARCRLRLVDLPAKLDQLLAISAKTTYKDRFPWVDNIAEVRDRSLKDHLDLKLVHAIRTGQLHAMWLAIPEILDWPTIGGFRYSRSPEDERLPDVHFSSFLGRFKDINSVDLNVLKKNKVHAISAVTDHEIDSWSIYRCICGELEHKGATYLLNGGSWYRVDPSFVRRVRTEIDTIGPTKGSLPDMVAGEDEGSYNVRLAKSLPRSAHLDRQLLSYGGGRSRIEFCDVMAGDRRLLHVKRYAGSSVLSHLFAQGVVSATAFASDEAFRAEVNAKLPPHLRLPNPRQRPDSSKYEVGYVVASRSSKALVLPFFSSVTLRNAHQTLRGLGYSVTLTKVRAAAPA
jgi:uncharacterized protein (TIGR04141 family)